MNGETYSERVKQTLQAAQNETLLRGHTRLEAVHVLAELLKDESGLAVNLIEHAGGRTADLQSAIGTQMSKLAVQSAGRFEDDAVLQVDCVDGAIALTGDSKTMH